MLTRTVHLVTQKFRNLFVTHFLLTFAYVLHNMVRNVQKLIRNAQKRCFFVSKGVVCLFSPPRQYIHNIMAFYPSCASFEYKACALAKSPSVCFFAKNVKHKTLTKWHCHGYLFHPKSPENEHPHPNPSIVEASTLLSEASFSVVDLNSNQNVSRTEHFSSSRFTLSFPRHITTLALYVTKMNILISIQAS